MRVVVVTPPVPFISYEDAVTRLKLDGDDDDRDDVEAMIASATAQLDGPDGWLGRCLGEQVLEAHFSAFDDPYRLQLPCPPVIEIEAVSWLGGDRQRRQADVDDYDQVGDVLYSAGTPVWTGMLVREDALTVRYRAGYGVVPGPIRDAVLLMVGNAMRNRDVDAPVAITAAVTNLVTPYRLYA
ncbi:hypothetical protein NF699_06435 [Sphingomonadaceae bacterium OTU29LAMAA1]|nr:hypothetical protein NF699_06435 [Sphingomonadaceae bacterium OTU29LAMAA1]